jgi:hypothetical protein
MRNTPYFEINIYDEQIELPTEDIETTQTNSFFTQSLSQEQKVALDSQTLKKITLATNKWHEVCEANNDSLNKFFDENMGGAFTIGTSIYDFQPFRAGKFWQMLDALDGNFILRLEGKITKDGITRERYQNHLLSAGPLSLSEDEQLLQTGMDLAINSALLSDLMPNKREHGSTYLFQHIIEDPDSLLYPSITNEFQKRIVNETFWQTLVNYPSIENNKALEKILTSHYLELDPSLAQDNIFRWVHSPKTYDPTLDRVDLVTGSGGGDSFSGLSQRAVTNYGKFIDKVVDTYKGDPMTAMKLVKKYVDAINCIDEDEINYFNKEQREQLLDLPCVRQLSPQKIN